MDRRFDILNSKSKWAVRDKAPITPQNISNIEGKLTEFTTCLLSLRNATGRQLVASKRRVFVSGYVATATACLGLARELFSAGHNMLLTFQLSQDHLESLLGKFRGMGGCNNNPGCIQLKSAIRKLLAKQYVVASIRSCVKILYFTSLGLYQKIPLNPCFAAFSPVLWIAWLTSTWHSCMHGFLLDMNQTSNPLFIAKSVFPCQILVQ